MEYIKTSKIDYYTWKVGAICLFFLILFVIFINTSLRDKQKDIEAGKSLTSYWACDDGCFYAICGDGITTNLSATCSDSVFQVCAEKCFNKFMEYKKFAKESLNEDKEENDKPKT